MCRGEWNREELAKGLILADVKIPFSSMTGSRKNPNGGAVSVRRKKVRKEVGRRKQGRR